VIEEQIRRGHPDLQGLCLALIDWFRVMEDRSTGPEF